MPDEPGEERLVLVAESTEQHEEREPALARDARAGGHVLGGLRLDVELDPLTAVGVDRPGDDRLRVATRLEDDTRRTDELAHHYPLRAVDDEGALVRHDGEVAHEDGLLFDLAGARVHEPRAHEYRRRVGHVLFLALVDRELRLRAKVDVPRVELQFQAELPGEVLDGAYVGEGLGEAPV